MEPRSSRWRATIFVVAAVLGAWTVAGCTDQGDDAESTAGVSDNVAPSDEIASLPGGTLEPGRYIFSSSDPDLDASHEITIDVPDGYEGFEGWAALKAGTSQTAVSTMALGGVYMDACQWKGSLLDGSTISSTDDVVTALASQEGLRVSSPTDVTVDGFASTYMERRVPAGTDLGECDDGQFRVYFDGRGAEAGKRYLVPGELQQLWVLDIQGVPLVIDASLNPGTSEQVRTELVQMAESVQIEPR